MVKRLFILVGLLALSFHLLAQEAKLRYGDLPPAAKEMLKTKYKKFAINSVKKNPSNPDQFRVEVQKGNKGFRLIYDQNGVLLSREKFKSFSFDGTEEIPDRSGPDSSPVPPM